MNSLLSRKGLTAFVLAIAFIALGTVSYADYQGKEKREPFPEFQAKMEERRAEMEAQREKMDAVMESGDYNAWAEFISEFHPDAPMLDVINADNFPRLTEMHQLQKEAREKMEAAHAIAEELGLPQPKMGRGMHKSMRGRCPKAAVEE